MSVSYDTVLSKLEPTRTFKLTSAVFSYLDTGKLLLGEFAPMIPNVLLDIDMSKITTGMSLHFLIPTDPSSNAGRFDYRLFYSNPSITGTATVLFRRLRQRDDISGTTIGIAVNNTIPVPVSSTPTLIGTSLPSVRGLHLILHFKSVVGNTVEIYAQEENFI